VDQQDADALIQFSRALRGAVSYVGAQRLARLVATLEKQQEGDGTRLHELLEDVEAEWQTVESQVVALRDDSSWIDRTDQPLTMLRVLVVDDDRFSRVLLREHLRLHAICDEAADAESAMRYIREAQNRKAGYHLVLLDITMPGMDGLRMLQAIRELETNAPPAGSQARTRIVMTTVVTDTQSLLDAFANQCDGYLVKPIRKQRLLAQLHELELLA
jgi:two-component system chemotaxis response regulator CheY